MSLLTWRRFIAVWTGSLLLSGDAQHTAHTVTRYPSGIFRQSWTPNTIRVGEAFVFGLEMEGAGEAFFALDTLAGKAYEVGQKVAVRFEMRGIPPIWKKIRVKGIEPG